MTELRKPAPRAARFSTATDGAAASAVLTAATGGAAIARILVRMALSDVGRWCRKTRKAGEPP